MVRAGYSGVDLESPNWCCEELQDWRLCVRCFPRRVATSANESADGGGDAAECYDGDGELDRWQAPIDTRQLEFICHSGNDMAAILT